MKKLLFKHLSRKQKDAVNDFIDLFYTKKVNRTLSFRVRSAFRTFFEGVINEIDFFDDVYDSSTTSYFIEPQTTIKLSDLAITNLKVYKYKGFLTLEITTSRPGICVGKGGRFIDSYTKFISDYIDQPNFKVRLKEHKGFFNY